MSFAIRPADAGDRTFIIQNWLDSYRTAFSAGLIAMEDWYKVMWPQVEKVLDRPGVRTLVAHETDETERVADLYGFITFDPAMRHLLGRDKRATILPTVVYVYVKGSHRRWGYARKLFAAAGIDPRSEFVYVCDTEATKRLRMKIPNAKWAPLSARFPHTTNERRPER